MVLGVQWSDGGGGGRQDPLDEGLKLPLNTTIQVWKGSEDVARIAGLGHRVIVRCVQQALRMHACIPCARAQEHGRRNHARMSVRTGVKRRGVVP